jgi:hypothetical protein
VRSGRLRDTRIDVWRGAQHRQAHAGIGRRARRLPRALDLADGNSIVCPPTGWGRRSIPVRSRQLSAPSAGLAPYRRSPSPGLAGRHLWISRLLPTRSCGSSVWPRSAGTRVVWRRVSVCQKCRRSRTGARSNVISAHKTRGRERQSGSIGGVELVRHAGSDGGDRGRTDLGGIGSRKVCGLRIGQSP